MSRVLIIGDPHLGKGISIGKPGIGIGLNSRIIDQKRILDWILDIGVEHNVDRFIITGDVFEDVKPDYSLIVMFMDWLNACYANNIIIDIILGNHDIRRSGNQYSSSLDIISKADIPNVTVYKNIHTVYTSGAAFTLLPYRDRRALDCDTSKEAMDIIASKLPYELADMPPGCDRVLVGHQALAGSIPIGDEFDDMINELMCPLEMFNGYDYVWMGHVHKPQVCSKSPYIAHIGSMDLSDFGETGHTKIIVLFDSNTESKFTEIPIPSRPLRRVRLTVPVGKEPTEHVCNEIKNIEEDKKFKNAIVKLEIRLDDPDALELDRKKITGLLKEYKAQHICSFSESRNVAVVANDKKDLVDSTVDPKSAIKLYANQLELNEIDNSFFIRLANEIVDEYEMKAK